MSELWTSDEEELISSGEDSSSTGSRIVSSTSFDEDEDDTQSHESCSSLLLSSPDPARSPSHYLESFASNQDDYTSSVGSPAPSVSRSLSSTSLNEDVAVASAYFEGEAKFPPLKISELESILENEILMLANNTTEDEHLRVRRLLSILIGNVVAAGSAPFDGRRQLQGFVIIEKFYWTADSMYGLRMPLNELLHHISLVEIMSSGSDCGILSLRLARRLALDFDGRFTSRIPWETIWWKHLLEPEGVNRIGQTRLPLHEVLVRHAFETCELQTSAPLLSLPTEIIRHILHLGAESLLPIVRSSLSDRQILHLRRSHFLTNAALSHSIFRQQAQQELVSFAYCRKGVDLDGLLDFIHDLQLSGSFTRIRIDFDFEEGEDEGALGGSLVRLSHWTHPRLKLIDFGGTLSADTVALFQNCEVQG